MDFDKKAENLYRSKKNHRNGLFKLSAGKSITSAFLAELISKLHEVCLVDRILLFLCYCQGDFSLVLFSDIVSSHLYN